jgi:hypothetical protein
MKKLDKIPDETHTFSDVIEAAKRSLKRVDDGEPLIWDGPSIGWTRMLGVVLQPDEDCANMDHHRENGRDELEVVLRIVFRLGVDQGARMLKEDLESAAETIDMIRTMINRI